MIVIQQNLKKKQQQAIIQLYQDVIIDNVRIVASPTTKIVIIMVIN